MESLRASIILEVLGRPAEHVKEALNTIIVKLGSEQGIKVISKTEHEPKPIEGPGELYTAFVEAELELKSLSHYFGILFSYMPAHIEIIHPEKIDLANADFNELGNSIVQRLHRYDAAAKRLIVERDMAMRKLQEVAPHLFKKAQNPNQQPIKQDNKKQAKSKPSNKKKSKKPITKKSKK